MAEAGGFPVTTGFGFPGVVVTRYLGVAVGVVVRFTSVSRSFSAQFLQVPGGEHATGRTEVAETSRWQAVDRMIENARLLGANAVVSMRFDSVQIGNQRAEVVAYGTAVIIAEPQQ